jgi:hypothetical protein
VTKTKIGDKEMQRRQFVLSSAAGVGLAMVHPLSRAQSLPEVARIFAGLPQGDC